MIRLKDVEMEYPNGTRAIRGISTTIEDGEFVFLVGTLRLGEVHHHQNAHRGGNSHGGAHYD